MGTSQRPLQPIIQHHLPSMARDTAFPTCHSCCHSSPALLHNIVPLIIVFLDLLMTSWPCLSSICWVSLELGQSKRHMHLKHMP